mmetsp:Transcript_2204/g.7304  ORF Transcript_2204/g.7304 Transcript_2204/m.7304 type:complete len:318 (+) Transcript_2204:2299-3252(+)
MSGLNVGPAASAASASALRLSACFAASSNSRSCQMLPLVRARAAAANCACAASAVSDKSGLKVALASSSASRASRCASRFACALAASPCRRSNNALRAFGGFAPPSPAAPPAAPGAVAAGAVAGRPPLLFFLLSTSSGEKVQPSSSRRAFSSSRRLRLSRYDCEYRDDDTPLPGFGRGAAPSPLRGLFVCGLNECSRSLASLAAWIFAARLSAARCRLSNTSELLRPGGGFAFAMSLGLPCGRSASAAAARFSCRRRCCARARSYSSAPRASDPVAPADAPLNVRRLAARSGENVAPADASRSAFSRRRRCCATACS